jgi:hypothetical protein
MDGVLWGCFNLGNLCHPQVTPVHFRDNGGIFHSPIIFIRTHSTIGDEALQDNAFLNALAASRHSGTPVA